jgi:hypothetical protein
MDGSPADCRIAPTEGDSQSLKQTSFIIHYSGNEHAADDERSCPKWRLFVQLKQSLFGKHKAGLSGLIHFLNGIPPQQIEPRTLGYNGARS